jgi:DeoR/GlpR family transcriptional regulator of sugar metabolism
MKCAERQLKLRELFASEEFIQADQLARGLGVSESTIRRDLIELENSGLLRRVHGGAISLQIRDEALDFGRLAAISHDEKIRIGKAAAALIKDSQTLILAMGSTVVEVAKNLFGRPVQVITNSVPVAQVFWDCKSVDVTMTGGYLFPRIGGLLGPVCDDMLSRISADVLVLGMAGVTPEGLSDSNTLIVGTVRKMIEVSRRVIVVVDHTKFGRKSMVHVAPLSEVDVVVTDSGLDPEHQRMLKEYKIDCILA